MKIKKMEYSKKKSYNTEVHFFGIWNIPGIFQKLKRYNDILFFLEYGIFQEYFKKNAIKIFYLFSKFQIFVLTNIPIFRLNNIFISETGIWNIPIFSCYNGFFTFVGIWNIPFFSFYNVFFWFLEYGIFQKKLLQQNIENFGIWNIPGIFQKKSPTTKMCTFLEYGIFHWIFLEYSKKILTTLGGVKFNQVI